MLLEMLLFLNGVKHDMYFPFQSGKEGMRSLSGYSWYHVDMSTHAIRNIASGFSPVQSIIELSGGWSGWIFAQGYPRCGYCFGLFHKSVDKEQFSFKKLLNTSFIELDAYDNSVIPQISVHCAHVSSDYEDHGFHTCIVYTDFIVLYSSNISNIK